MEEKKPNRYDSPTPKLWRRIGDSLLLASVTVTTYGALEEEKWVVIGAAIMGTVGKFLTNLFKKEE